MGTCSCSTVAAHHGKLSKTVAFGFALKVSWDRSFAVQVSKHQPACVDAGGKAALKDLK